MPETSNSNERKYWIVSENLMLITGRMKLKTNFRWSVLMRFHSLLRRLESVSVNWNNDELEPNSGSGFPASLSTASVGVFFLFQNPRCSSFIWYKFCWFSAEASKWQWIDNFSTLFSLWGTDGALLKLSGNCEKKYWYKWLLYVLWSGNISSCLLIFCMKNCIWYAVFCLKLGLFEN